jgi:hypothetical protein
MKVVKLYALAILIIGGLIFFNQVQAARLSISPVTFELTGNPGDVLVNKLRIFNSSNASVAINMEIEDFAVAGEEGEVIVREAENETYSLAKWISVNPSSFTLAPNEQKFVDFIITIPLNAEPGGKYGSVLAGTRGIMSPDEEIIGAAVSAKIGALVLLTVSGDVVENLEIKEFSVSSFSETGPIPFVIRFENTGTVHVRPRGFVTITDWRGKKAIDIEFPQHTVIPGSVRKIETSWDKKWAFGRFTATLIGNYGTSNIPLSPPVVVFWVFPWRIALGVFITLALITTYFVKTRKRWKMALRILIKGEKH